MLLLTEFKQSIMGLMSNVNYFSSVYTIPPPHIISMQKFFKMSNLHLRFLFVSMQTLQQSLLLNKHVAAMGGNDSLQPNPVQSEQQVAAHDLGLRRQNRHTYIPKEVHLKEHYLDQIKCKQDQW